MPMLRPRSKLLCRPTPWLLKLKHTLMHRSAPSALPVSLCACVCLPACCLLASLLSACLPTCLTTNLSLPVCLPTCMSICVSTSLPVYESVTLPASAHAMHTSPIVAVSLVSSLCCVEHHSHSISWHQHVEQSDRSRWHQDVNCGHEGVTECPGGRMSSPFHSFVSCPFWRFLPGARTIQH